MSIIFKNYVWVIIVLFAIAGVVILNKNMSEGVADTIKIGDITFLTGPVASIGEQETNAIKIAIDEINNKGGINGKKIELFVEDYAYDAKRAIPAYQSLKSKGIKLFIIEGSGALGPIMPILRQNNDFSIVPNATLPTYVDKNPLTCRVSITSEGYGDAIGGYLISKFKKPRVAFLISAKEYGEGVKIPIAKHVNDSGGEIIQDESFDQSASDFRTQLTKIKSRLDDIDALIIINAGNTIEGMLRQIRDFGFNKLIVTDTFTALNSQLKTKSLADGIVFVDYTFSLGRQNDDSENTSNFKNKYFDLYGEYPTTSSANAYDAISVMLKGLKGSSDDNPKSVSDYIINTLKSYEGVGGRMDFNDDCEVSRSSTLKIIKGGKPVLLN